ncbi:hypothetical protein ABPG72_005275 [Tetrahymena utriculariae]
MYKSLREFHRGVIVGIMLSGLSVSRAELLLIENDLKASEKSISRIFNEWKESGKTKPDYQNSGCKKALKEDEIQQLKIQSNQTANPKGFFNQYYQDLSLNLMTPIVFLMKKDSYQRVEQAQKNKMGKKIKWAKSLLRNKKSAYKKTIFTVETQICFQQDQKVRVWREKDSEDQKDGENKFMYASKNYKNQKEIEDSILKDAIQTKKGQIRNENRKLHKSQQLSEKRLSFTANFSNFSNLIHSPPPPVQQSIDQQEDDKLVHLDDLPIKDWLITKNSWILGLAKRGKSFDRTILIPVEKRDQYTLVPLITKFVSKLSLMVCTDQWKAYCSLKEQGFYHQSINNSQNLVVPLKRNTKKQKKKNYKLVNGQPTNKYPNDRIQIEKNKRKATYNQRKKD